MRSEGDVRRILATISIARLRESGLLDSLLRLTDSHSESGEQDLNSQTEEINSMDVDHLIRLAREGGASQDDQDE